MVKRSGNLAGGAAATLSLSHTNFPPAFPVTYELGIIDDNGAPDFPENETEAWRWTRLFEASLIRSLAGSCWLPVSP